MAEASFGSSSPVGSLSSEDHDFDPTAEMLIHEYDDERTLEEEELLEGEKNFTAELSDLEREGNMPIEELLAMYRYEASVSTGAGSSMDSSSVELADDLPDMTLDKEEIAKDLLSGDYEEETQSSADDLTPSVTSHEATDFFPRTLRSNATYDGDKESEGEEDCVSSEDSRKEIMVGSQYQAEVPVGLSHYNDDEVYEEEDQLLWCPDVLSECKVKDYLSEALSQSTDDSTENSTSENIRDNEQALFELLKCNYDTREALTRYRSNVKTLKEESPPWSEDECRNFEHALQIYEKNFHLIQKHKVQTRTVAECVAFYYMWKKSERFDYFAQQNRFGKKKYSCYPGVTDLMDRLVDEAEGLAVDSSSSVCSAGPGGRMEASAEQQLGLLNSITASDLTAISNSVATVCNGPGDISCLDSPYFPPLESLHRGALNHDDQLSYATNGDSGCLSMLDSGFYRSDLGHISVCSTKDCERPSKRLKMGLSESFINDVSVTNLDFEGRRAHCITGATMAVSVTDFSSIGSSETNGFLGSHSRHNQHTALQSD
ncbi:mesoderm induction early response protein 3 isoform X2 [Sinocyclocheilus anshuiensis]|uniref:mesoderm induction early response protein 3 isoform X2 n=1 Tax=Sinocyclocheilus anshuiensis TaxID=1608454 RepID=UPI0007B96713|nr:PREDICTED: mesoderm induction early response protein 3-like isoform X2 [Sinocyclocheilus anshuiensis]